MPCSYPLEFRRRVLDLVASGRPIKQVAEMLGISDQTIYNWRRQRGRGAQVQGTVNAVCVVVLDVLLEHPPEVTLPEQQHPIGTLCAYRAHPPFRERVHPRALRRRTQHLDPLSGEHGVECVSELPATVPDQIPDAA